MGREIERKFLVTGDGWRQSREALECRQGYLALALECTVRVRTVGAHGYLTVKGARTGLSRLEYEYEIPFSDAQQMLEALCEKPLIEKIRHYVEFGGMLWEVDEFLGENAGLVVAEVELKEERQAVDLPEWVGREVSADPRYTNASLVRHPYSRWKTPDFAS
jgi:CYTH domain-containing protein